jgi:hypothetical protein
LTSFLPSTLDCYSTGKTGWEPLVLTNYRDDSPTADTGQSIPEHLLTR